MLLKALDTIRVSSAGRGTLRAGDEFEVSDHEGEILVKRGLAAETKGKPKAETKGKPKAEDKGKPKAEDKGAAAPENKAAAKPADKAKK